MENNQRVKEIPSRKQITFDISDGRLKLAYPRSKVTLNPMYHKKGWNDIARFMRKNGFEHRQRSVYASKMEMTRMDVNALIKAMLIRMPWICKCLNAIDVTDIGEQHDLMPFVKGVEIELEQEKIEKTECVKEEAGIPTREELKEQERNNKQNTMDGWMAEITKKRAEVGESRKHQPSRHKSEKDRTDH